MAALETYLTELTEAQGIEYMTKLQNLRTYIHTSTEKELINAIQKIENIWLLKHLIAAGLKPPLLKAVLTRYDELSEKRGE